MRLTPYMNILCGLLFLSSCTQTHYADHLDKNSAPPFMAEMVKFRTTERFFLQPPNCVTVLPVKGMGKPEFKKLVGITVARHLYQKVKRTIGPFERNSLERSLAFDLDNNLDRKQFSIQKDCAYFAQVRVNHVSKAYALVWAEQTIDLNIKVHGYDENDMIWQASHIVNRGDGGLPLSPFSLGAAVFTAGRAHRKADTLPSMLDDSMRRMFVKFPDTRIY